MATTLLLLAAGALPLQQSSLRTHYGLGAGDFFGGTVVGVGDLDRGGTDEVAVGAPGAFLNGGYVSVLNGHTGALVLLLQAPTVEDGFGVAIANAGDWNADTVDDLAVGASGTGSVTVFSGSDGVPLRQFDGSFLGFFGVAVANAGDVNGDGTPDLAIGEPFGGPEITGAVHVFSGADGARLYSALGAATNDGFGSALLRGADWNQDGVAELLVGAPYHAGNAGQVQALSGADGALLGTLSGAAAGDFFGQALCGAGDWDGDGTADFAISAHGADAAGLEAGALTVHAARDGRVLAEFLGEQAFDRFGLPCTEAGDVDGDGHSELAAGTAFGIHPHYVLLFQHGSGDLLMRYQALDNVQNFGYAVGAGDWTGDGRSDLALGAPFAAPAGFPVGGVYLYSSSGLEANPPSPGLAGRVNTVTVGNGFANQPMALFSSFVPGFTAWERCYGLGLLLAQPRPAGTALADFVGRAIFTGFVPASLSGRTVFLQALQEASCRLSNRVQYTFP